jgi:hypothetical protein
MNWAAVSIALLVGGLQVNASAIDFEVGLDNSDQTQLTVIRPSQVDEPYTLARIASGDFVGYYMNIEPGWDGLAVDRPAQNVMALDEVVEVALLRVNFDSEFKLYDIDGNEILASDGDTHVFAGEPESDEMRWHEHLIFAVEPGADVSQTYSATFRLVDTNDAYGESEAFTLTFQPVEPQQCGGGGCGAIGITGILMPIAGLARFRRR